MLDCKDRCALVVDASSVLRHGVAMRLKWIGIYLALSPMPSLAQATWDKYKCQINGQESVCVESRRRDFVVISGGSVGGNFTGTSLDSLRESYEEQAKASAYGNLPRDVWWWCADVGWQPQNSPFPAVSKEQQLGGGTAITEKRNWALEYVGGTTGYGCTVTQPGTWNAEDAVVWSRHTYYPECPDQSWTYVGPEDVRAGPGQCYQNCPVGTIWSPEANACKPVRIKVDQPPPTCGHGNPIYPLTGSKTEDQLLLALGVGKEPVAIRYDTRSAIRYVDDKVYPVPAPPPSFGRLWASSLHKSLTLEKSTNGSGLDLTAIAARGLGMSTTFLGSTNGCAPWKRTEADKLFGYAYSLLYRDARGLALETYPTSGSLSIAKRSYASGGNLSYTYDNSGLLTSVSDHFGRTVSFEYESTVAGTHIRSVVDPAGQRTNVGYGSTGNITEITWPDNTVRRYVYENPDYPWALTGIIDENNKRIGTYGYDSAGIATSTERAGGTLRYSTTYGQSPRRTVNEYYDSTNDVVWHEHKWILPTSMVLSTPNGDASAIDAVVVDGTPRVTARSQPAGSGCSASISSQSYDVNGNISRRDDFNGSRTCYAYDLTRNLEIARVEGLPNTVECDSVTAPNAVLPLGSRKISTTWHPDWPLVTRQAEPGKVTTFVYNGQVDPLNNVGSCAPSNALLPDKKPIAVLCKKIEQATIDPSGGRGFVLAGVQPANPDPYFANVSLLLHMDTDDGRVSFADSSSRTKPLSSVVSPLVLDESNAQFGSAGANFTGGYLQYPASPDFDMGGGDFTVEAWVRFNSASVGSRSLLFGQADSGGGNTTFAVSKSTSEVMTMLLVTNAGTFAVTGTNKVSPNVWYHLALVRSGNTLTLYRNGAVDLLGSVSGVIPTRTSKFGVGAVGQYAGVYGGSSGARMMGWIDEFRVTKGVARYTAPFAPPSLPFASSEEGSAGTPSAKDSTVTARSWTYTYNEFGQILTARGPRTDVNDTTTYTYYTDTTAEHTKGDLKTATDAVGLVTQYTKYNKYGQLLESMDPNGVVTTHTYDARQRLVATQVGEQTSTYSYDAAGQLIRVTSSDGSYVGYEYDDAHRLIAVVDSLGNRVDYTLDNAGNRIAENVKDPGGALVRQLSRSIDALGRVQQSTGRE